MGTANHCNCTMCAMLRTKRRRVQQRRYFRKVGICLSIAVLTIAVLALIGALR